MSSKLKVVNSPWYKDGLRFECTQCGKCCSGSPGYIWVTEEEIQAMSQFLNLSIDLFKRRYLKRRDNRFLIVERKSDYSCIFFKDNKCEVYAARPVQCRTYPFWEENIRSSDSWKLASQACEGINDQAPLVPYTRIQELLELEEPSSN